MIPVTEKEKKFLKNLSDKRKSTTNALDIAIQSGLTEDEFDELVNKNYIQQGSFQSTGYLISNLLTKQLNLPAYL